MVHNKCLVVVVMEEAKVVEMEEVKVVVEKGFVNLIYQIYTKDIVHL